MNKRILLEVDYNTFLALSPANALIVLEEGYLVRREGPFDHRSFRKVGKSQEILVVQESDILPEEPAA